MQNEHKSPVKPVLLLAVRESRASGDGKVPAHSRTADREECDNAAKRH